MTIGINVEDGGILYGILEDLGGDIVLKVDRDGFIEHASAALGVAGFDLEAMLIAPHLADLTDSCHTDLLRDYCSHVLRTGQSAQPIHVPLCAAEREPRWFALTLRPLPVNQEQLSQSRGAICILRCIEEERALEHRLFQSAMTDALTGIANRHAFLGSVTHLMAAGQSGAIILFEIDRFRAIGLRFGQQASDSVIQAFAGFLSNMLEDNHTLARLEDNRFAVMLPSCERREAIDFATEIVSTFAEISRDAELEEMRLTASASVSQLSGCLDDTLVRGEVALTMARSAGGFRVECGDAIRGSWRKTRPA